MTQVYDLSDPAQPVKIRDFGLVGQQPGADRRGADRAARPDLDRAAGQPRLFRLRHQQGRRAADRRPREAARTARRSRRPRTCAIRRSARLDMPPCNGAHTAFPMLEMPIAEFAKDKDGATRDIVMIVDEAIRNECHGAAADGVVRRRHRSRAQPMVVSNFDGARGERQFLPARRPLRLAFVEREHGAGLLQEARLHRLLQRRRARASTSAIPTTRRRSATSSRRSPRRPTSAASRSTARTAARSRSRPTTSRSTTAATSTSSTAPTPACTSSS